MIRLIIDTTKKFLWDESYATQKLRALLFFLGWALNSGAIPITVINEHLGPASWWLGGLIQAFALFIRSGDKNIEQKKES